MNKDKTMKELQHEYDSTRGLWCIDRDPKEVDIHWIREMAFRLKDIPDEDISVESENPAIVIIDVSKRSGNVLEIAYEKDKKDLFIVMEDGCKYQYLDVPVKIWDGFRKAMSLGAFMHRELKGYYRYVRIE